MKGGSDTATRDIKTRFKLEGEQEFKKQMTDAANAIKVLNSEQKLAKAQFEATGNAEQYAAEQARILREQIKQQEKAVEAAESAVKGLTENGVQPNDKAMQQWRTKLANARTTLIQMQTKLEGVEGELADQSESLETAEGSAESYNEEMAKVGEGINIANTIDAIDRIRDRLKQVITAAAQAVKAVWELGANAGHWADDIQTAATQVGVDAETYQSWKYASRFIDTEVDDIVRSWQDIDKKMKDSESTVSMEFESHMAELGIATRQAGTTFRDSQDIFWDAIDYLNGIEDSATLARDATYIFGQDWRKLQPLIDAGSAAYAEMAEQGRDVAVVSNEEVAALAAVDDSIQDLEARAEKLKLEALAALAPTFESVAQSLSEAVTAFNEFVSSDEGQAALNQLNETVGGLVDSFLGTGGETFTSLVLGAKDAVGKLTEALGWLNDNQGLVIGAVGGIGAAFAGLTVAKDVLTFVQLLNGIKSFKLFSGGSGAGSAVGNAAQAAKSAIGSSAVGVPLGAGLFVGTVAAASAAIDASATNAMNQKIEQTEQLAEDAASATGEVNNLSDALRTLNQIYQGEAGAEAFKTMDLESMRNMVPNAWIYQYLDQFGTIDNWMQSGEPVGAQSLDLAENLIDELTAYIEKNKAEQAAVEAGAGVAEGLAEGLNNSADTATEASQALADSIIETAQTALDEHSPSGVFEEIGANASIGLANGIYRNSGAAIRAAQQLANAVTAIMRSVLRINSPSKVFEELGTYTGEGFALGLQGSTDAVNKAINTMLGVTGRTPSIALPDVYSPTPANRARGRTGSMGNDTVNVTMVLDERVLGEVMAPIVNQELGARIQAVRR